MKSEVLEQAIQLDKDGVPWIIERMDDYMTLTYDGGIEDVPDPTINTIVIDKADFDSYYKLREQIKSSTTMDIWEEIKSAVSLLEQVILDIPPPPEIIGGN